MFAYIDKCFCYSLGVMAELYGSINQREGEVLQKNLNKRFNFQRIAKFYTKKFFVVGSINVSYILSGIEFLLLPWFRQRC